MWCHWFASPRHTQALCSHLHAWLDTVTTPETRVACYSAELRIPDLSRKPGLWYQLELSPTPAVDCLSAYIFTGVRASSTPPEVSLSVRPARFEVNRLVRLPQQSRNRRELCHPFSCRLHRPLGRPEKEALAARPPQPTRTDRRLSRGFFTENGLQNNEK